MDAVLVGLVFHQTMDLIGSCRDVRMVLLRTIFEKKQ